MTKICSVLIDGSQAVGFWRDAVERLGPIALEHMVDCGLVPAQCEVSVLLVTDAEIQELNCRYRGVDAPTDVLSFSQLEGPFPQQDNLPPDYIVPLGDIVLSIPRVQAQAVEYGHSEERELGYLLVHGLLHLVGFDHQSASDAQAMRVAEEDVLAAADLRRESSAI